VDKTLVTLAFIVLAVLGIAGVFLVLLFNPAAASVAVTLVVTVLGIATTGIVTFYNLGKQTETINTIQRQTNGNTSALQAEVARLGSLLALAAPIAPSAVAESRTPTEAITVGRHSA
jgi:hypothetical protein